MKDIIESTSSAVYNCGFSSAKRFEHDTMVSDNQETCVKSANIHIIAACNYRCGFCFTKNLEHVVMTLDQWEPIFTCLKKLGISKINFAGGEPTMYPHFIEICELTKSMGFTVSIVSNGSKINSQLIQKMKESVGWVGLSVDSPDNEVEKAVGRQCADVNHIENIIKAADLAHENGIKVKLNITVIKQSWNQDFSNLIRRINPDRVKAFKVHKIEGENEDSYDEYSITNEKWNHFVITHENIILNNGEKIVFEGDNDMIDSYLMLDPRGMIMRDSGNKVSYQPFSVIQSEGIEAVVNPKKYHDRGAEYDWGDSQ